MKELDALNQVNPTLLETISPPKQAKQKPTLKATGTGWRPTPAFPGFTHLGLWCLGADPRTRNITKKPNLVYTWLLKST